MDSTKSESSRHMYAALPYLATLSTTLIMHGKATSAGPTDFAVYERFGKMVASGYHDIYSDHGGLPFTYPPFAAALFAAFQATFKSLFVWLLFIASIIATVIIIQTLLKWARPSTAIKSQSLLCTLICVPLILSEPFYRNFHLGQINIILTAALFLGVYRNVRWWPGVLVGLCAGIKLTPALYGLIFLVRRDWKNAASSIACGFATLLVGFVALPHASADYWSGKGFDAGRVGGVSFAGNQSINGMLVRLFSEVPHEAVLLTAQLAVLVAGCAAAWVWRMNLVHCFGVTTVVGLLISPISWSHHWVAAIIAFASIYKIAVQSTGFRRISSYTVLVLGVILFMTHIIWVGDQYNEVELHQSLIITMGQSAYVIWGASFIVWSLVIARLETNPNKHLILTDSSTSHR